MPNFNIGGHTQINTLPGGFLSIMVIGLTLIYGGVKFIDFYMKSDPNIRQNSKPDSYATSTNLTFSDDINFRLALGTRYVSSDPEG